MSMLLNLEFCHILTFDINIEYYCFSLSQQSLISIHYTLTISEVKRIVFPDAFLGRGCRGVDGGLFLQLPMMKLRSALYVVVSRKSMDSG